MKQLKYCLLALLWPVLNATAQTTPIPWNGLQVGDKVPLTSFPHLYNSPAKKLNLQSFKGKLIILDFWATWCGSCIETMPEMQALQQQFNNHLQVILVNDQPEMDSKKLSAFFEKRKAAGSPITTVPCVYRDTMLRHYFPHQGLPHCVWIDQEGRVAAITFPQAVTAANIQNMLSGKGAPATTKNDALLFDKSIPFLTGKNGDPSDFLYRSVLSGPIKNIGAPGGRVENDLGLVTRYYDINNHLSALFRTAYPEVFSNVGDRVMIEGPFNFDALYCYELITPPVPWQEIIQYLRQDLYRCFHVVAKKELRPVTCYTVVANNRLPQYFTTHATASAELGRAATNKHLYNQSIDFLLDNIGPYLHQPVFNETGVSQHIDVDLPNNIYTYNVSQLRDWLFDKGFTLVDTVKELEVAVLTTDTGTITTITKQ
jgi:thiol-disulfide isomerase/thioredoxin